MEPKKHHYIPAFYLKRWAGADDCIVQWSTPHGRSVKPLRVHSNATGYLNRLYEIRGFPDNLSQQIESDFFKPIDNLASEVLVEIETNKLISWNNRNRSAWTKFIISLLLRCPEDLISLRDRWYAEFSKVDKETENKYQLNRKENDQETLAERLRNLPESKKEMHFYNSYLMSLNSANIERLISGLDWNFLDVVEGQYEFLTSDRPIIRTNGLGQKNGHLLLPIGPKRLFVAAKDITFVERLRQSSNKQLILRCNRNVVSCAVKYAYSKNDESKSFIQKHFGTGHDVRLAESILNMRK